MDYLIEEFSQFCVVRLHFKPAEATSIKLLFLRKYGSDVVHVLIGPKVPSHLDKLVMEGTDDPDGIAPYTTAVTFNLRLITMLGVKKVDTVDDLINNVPLFMLSSQVFKKILWEELHDPVEKKLRQSTESKQQMGSPGSKREK